MIEKQCIGMIEQFEERVTWGGKYKTCPVFRDCRNPAWSVGRGRYCTACLKARAYWVLLIYSTVLTTAGAVGAVAYWGLQ